MKLHRRQVLLTGAAIGVAAVGATPFIGWAAETVQVRIPADKAAFEPEEIQIKVGDTVRWTNDGIVTHTITCDPAKVKDAANCALPAGAAAFDSGDLGLEENFEQVFTVPGTYRYFCIPHENMKMVGVVVVSA